jgi:hypothetical protein
MSQKSSLPQPTQSVSRVLTVESGTQAAWPSERPSRKMQAELAEARQHPAEGFGIGQKRFRSPGS